MLDALVIGSGPAGLEIAAALCNHNLQVQGLAPTSPVDLWTTTYGIWVDELDTLGLSNSELNNLLKHRWKDCVGYFGPQPRSLNREYGLFDNAKLQTHLLRQCMPMKWHQGLAKKVEHTENSSTVTTQSGEQLSAKIIIDATGHQPVLIQRPVKDNVAYQAAYGIVARCDQPPIQSERCVLMDYRDGHLATKDKIQPPTFLYAMDLGNNIYFLEETSLAYHPEISFKVLRERLYQRLIARQVKVLEVHHEEHCLFPMNLPLPDFKQRVVGFGDAASMVHPATGYMVGALLRRAPVMAKAIATALTSSQTAPSQITPAQLSKIAWKALWPNDRIRKYYIYSFGLEALISFDNRQLCRLFGTFFRLPLPQWAGFLADDLSTPLLLAAMINMFGKASNALRADLVRTVSTDGGLLWKALWL